MTVRRSLAWAISGQIVAFAAQFVGLVVVSRLLSPREIGIYTIALALQGIVQVFTTFGLVAFVVREVELPARTLDAAFTLNALLVGVLSLLLVGASFAARPLLGVPEAGPVLRILAVTNLFALLNFRPLAMLQREMAFRDLSALTATTAVLQAGTTITFAVLGASYMSAAYGALVTTTLATVLTQRVGRRHVSFRLSLADWRPISAFGLQIMSIGGVAALNGKLSDLLVGRFLGVTALGYYGRASQLSAIIFESLYGTATRVVFVKLSQDFRNGADWRGTYLRSFAMITAVMWPFLIGLAVLARPAVSFVYGEQWLPAALPLAAMMVFQLIGVAFGMNWELFVLRGETGRQARFEAARFLFGIPIFAIGCLFNIVWAAIAKIPDALIGLFLYYPHVRRLAELDRRAIPTVYVQGAVLTIAAVLPAVGLMIAYDWSASVPLPLTFAAVGVGIASWLVAIVLLRHPLLNEFVLLGRRLRIIRAG